MKLPKKRRYFRNGLRSAALFELVGLVMAVIQCKTQHSILTNDSTKSDLRTFVHRDDFEIFGSTPTWVLASPYTYLSVLVKLIVMCEYK